MKKSMYLMVVALISMTMMFCTKEGPVGPRGPAGSDGTDGNANVITYLITDSATIAWNNSNSIYLYYDSLFAVPDSIRNEGVILIYMQYVNTGTAWYFVPGLGPDGFFNTRIWIQENFIRIYALDPDGTIFSGTSLYTPFCIRVVLIPSTTVISMTADKVDINSYEATMEYLGLEK